MIMNMALGGFRAKYAVTYPSGSTCKVHCDAESITLTAPNTSGSYTFTLPVRGTWYASCTDGTQTVKSVTHVASNGGSYSDTLEYPVPTPTFTATVKVTYPTGLTCRLSDGSTTLYADNTSGYFAFTVPNAGTWTATAPGCTAQQASVTQSGQERALHLRIPVTVTIIGSTNSSTYNGSAKTAEGYTATSSYSQYSTSNFSFSGTARVTRTNAGTTYMGLSASQFTNNNDDYAVTFSVTDGYVAISPLAVSVSVTGHSGRFTYDGSNHTVSGFDLSSSSTMYSTSNVNYSGTSVATRKDAGTTTVSLDVNKFSNLNSNFTVTFSILANISITITQKSVTVNITGSSNSGTYTGKAITASGYTATIATTNSGYSKSSIKFNGTSSVSRTDVGTSYMGLKASDFSNTDSSFTVTFNIVTDGSVTVTSKAATVKANDASKAYGAADPAFTATVSGTVGSDTVQYSISRVAGENAGTYSIIPSGASTQGNYSVTYQNGTFTIGAPTTGTVIVNISMAANVWCTNDDIGYSDAAAGTTQAVFSGLQPGNYLIYYTDGIRNNYPGITVNVVAGGTVTLNY